ncbi:MAG: pyridoxamine 5'-phosphate oxidase family protein [Nitrososphaera sp.]|uniref:pyridoxamine 5'-phosphate oxidase family protein n=1 Tax=Nitrososphaera sp. TaxID=1971748 RepID=UPI003D6E50E7
MKFPLADKNARRLNKKEIGQLLAGPNLLRLAFMDGGAPMVHPVWFVYEGEKFWVAVDREGAKARCIRENPGVYFLVDVGSSPPRGVRGRGTAMVIDDPAFATEITEKCVKKYLKTARTKKAREIIEMGKESCAIEITPGYMASWKF